MSANDFNQVIHKCRNKNWKKFKIKTHKYSKIRSRLFFRPGLAIKLRRHDTYKQIQRIFRRTILASVSNSFFFLQKIQMIHVFCFLIYSYFSWEKVRVSIFVLFFLCIFFLKIIIIFFFFCCTLALSFKRETIILGKLHDNR